MKTMDDVRDALAKPRGMCMANGCGDASDTGGSLCRAHWLSLDVDRRREIVRAANAFRHSPDRHRRRFRHAWYAALEFVNQLTAVKEVYPLPEGAEPVLVKREDRGDGVAVVLPEITPPSD